MSCSLPVATVFSSSMASPLQVWFNILFYDLAFEPFGPIVKRVFQVSSSIRQFLLMMLFM